MLLSADNRVAAVSSFQLRQLHRHDDDAVVLIHWLHLAQSAGVLVAGDGQATAGPQQSTLQTKQNLTRFNLPFAWSQWKDNMSYNIIMLAVIVGLNC